MKSYFPNLSIILVELIFDFESATLSAKMAKDMKRFCSQRIIKTGTKFGITVAFTLMKSGIVLTQY